MRATWTWAVAIVATLLLAISPALGQSTDKEPHRPVVAVFDLSGTITEKPVGEELPFGPTGVEPLKDLVARLKKARDDKAVKAVVLLAGTGLDPAQTEEVRQVMDQIKAAGKPIHAHVDYLTTSPYVLLSGASTINVVPTGHVFVFGLYGSSPYLRGLLDKIGVQPDFLTCGAYKSASEIFMRTGPSPEAERMTNWLLDSLYQSYVDLIAKGRDVPQEKARQWIDGSPYTAEQAQKAGLIDTVQFRQDFVAGLKQKYGKDVVFKRKYGKGKSTELDLSSPFGVFKLWAELLQGPSGRRSTKSAIAIVYVEGPIVPGKPSPSPFGGVQAAYSTPIARALDKAAKDDSVKAVVLRVNSPGGSAVASEIILNASKRVKAKKPFVVSMGYVAGSGGYYVACGADTIFADRTTITGSIGVVGGKFATTDMWDKIGITWKSHQRGANAALLASDAVFSAQERKKFQDWMDEIYGVFKQHVVAIRGDRLKKKIDDLAGGRVFTGSQALELGLIDKIGSLDAAVAHVAAQAKLDDYELRVIPRPKNFLEIMLGDIAGKEDDEQTISVGRPVTQSANSVSVLDLALPYLRQMDPQRMASVKMALRRLDMLQHEGVLLMMPEIIIGN